MVGLLGEVLKAVGDCGKRGGGKTRGEEGGESYMEQDEIHQGIGATLV